MIVPLKTYFLSVTLLLIHSLCSFGLAHSIMTFPEPYTRDNCKGGVCEACPHIYSTTPLTNTESSPELTWKRGQNVTIVWARNNHGGGFVRLAFVPVSKRTDISAHEQFAFYYGCWEQNIFPCSGSLCESDKTHRAFRAFTTVPTVIPNGVYLLAQIWYGGLKWTRHHGAFSDYASCSFVRIEGGEPLQPAFRPVFEPGNVGEFESTPPGKCLTSAVKVGECLTGCDDVASFFAVPYEFDNGRIPPPLTPRLYGALPSMPTSAPNPGTDSGKSGPRTPHTRGSSEKSGRVCKRGYCCPKSCGECGGRGCGLRPGGLDACCIHRIKASGRRCSQHRPPCIRSHSWVYWCFFCNVCVWLVK